MCHIDIPELDDLKSMIAALETELQQLRSEIRSYAAATQQPAAADNGLVLGLFKPNEVVYMSDKRLFALPESPFKSRAMLYKSRENGCRWTTTGGQRSYCIKAEDLRDWILCADLKKKKYA